MRRRRSSSDRRAMTYRLVVAAVGLAVWAAYPALARAEPDDGTAGPKYQRRSVEVKTRGSIDAKGQQEAVRRKQAKHKPTLDAASLAAQREAVAMAVVEKQIATLHKLIEASDPADAEFPDLLFRLADLHLSVKAHHEMQAGALAQRIYELRESGAKDQARQERAKQKRHRSAAKKQAELAVAAYAKLVTNPRFTSYKRFDEALYYYAAELGGLGRSADMQQALARLVREFPTSSYTPNAYLTFGDLKFAEGDIQNAERLYQKVVDGYPDSPTYAYALYKIGWCNLNPIGTADPDYEASLGAFVAAIEATKQGRAGSEANGRLLRRDARRDLVRAYVHAGRPSKAWAFMTRHGTGPKKSETMAREMMERLASAYFGEGMYIASSSAYRDLQRRFADDPDVCHWQHRIVVNALATDDADIQWKETERLADVYRNRDKSWSKTEAKRCRDATRDTLARLATVWHDEADKTGRDETYARSARAYEAYEDLFAKSKDTYRLAFYHGEVLWQRASRLLGSKKEQDRNRGRALFRDAAEQFEAVLRMKPKGKWAKEAAYAQMLGWKNHLNYDETATARRGCAFASDGSCRSGDAAAKHEPIPMGDDERAMLAAYDRYAEFIDSKADTELPKILYHRARIYVEHNAFNEAKPLLRDLVEGFEGTVYAVWATEMLLDVLSIEWSKPDNTAKDKLEQGRELERFVRSLKKSKTYEHAEAVRLRKAAPGLIAAVGWVEAGLEHDAGKAGDPEGFVRCGRKYREIYLEFDEHDRADELLFNAARCLEAGYLLGQAISAREELLRRFPSSKLTDQTMREVAENYQRIAYYDRAAERFEQYAERNPNDDYTPQALQNAYLFRIGLGEDKKAAADLDRYERMFRRKDPMRAAKVFWSRHDLIEDDDERLAHAKEYIRSYGKRGGPDRLVVAHAAAGEILWRRSCPRPLLHDSCISIKRKKASTKQETLSRAATLRRRSADRLPSRCGEDTQAVITVHRRDPKLAEQAQNHFGKAAALARKVAPPDEDDRAENFRDAWGMAEVFRADATYEQYLQVRIPEHLDFGLEHMWKKDSGIPRYEREYAAAMKRRQTTLKRFKSFFDQKDALATELAERYAAVRDTQSPHWILAAAARAAMVNQNFADQLYRAPIPKGLKTWEQHTAYCDEIAKFATGPEKRAVAALDYCLQRSTKYQFFNDYSRMCEEELQQLDADRYPATNELFGTSEYTSAEPQRVPVQTSAPTDLWFLDKPGYTGGDG